ncbi:MAG: aldose 1-epimerase family protein [Nonomuraea sp.]|nr:aldose 1-epimerase family protein [Nonomuraea sp.]
MRDPRLGDPRQHARIERFVEEETGERRIRVATGGGLEFDVHPDRCLDLGMISANGVQLAWLGPRDTGGGGDWRRTFRGGLMATCGLDTFGSPSADEGEEYGLHGAIGTHAATEVSTSSGDELVITGSVRQARLFAENLVLHRRITTRVGSNRVEVHDTVVNDGFEAAPQMLLYHLNLGWPVLDQDAVLDLPSDRVTPRDADAERGLDSWGSFGPPYRGFREQVFRHDLPPDTTVTARLSSGRASLAVEVDTATLPWMFQWKMLGQGAYVLGLEPANCPVIEGRASARKAGVLPVLEPGERRDYHLAFEVFGKSVA